MCKTSFNPEKTFTYVKGDTASGHMFGAMKALNFAREKHDGQFRKSGDPYIIHPLIMACNALALGIEDENVIAGILLHDVCEDCLDEAGNPIKPSALPVNDEVRRCVELLTFTVNDGETKAEAKKRYYTDIRQSREAVLAKLIDRCNNISNMAGTFTIEKLTAYIEETKEYIYPLMHWAKENYPEYSNMLFLLKYHMISVINSIEAMRSYSDMPQCREVGKSDT